MNIYSIYVFAGIPVYLGLFIYGTLFKLKEDITLGRLLTMLVVSALPFAREVIVFIIFIGDFNTLIL